MAMLQQLGGIGTLVLQDHVRIDSWADRLSHMGLPLEWSELKKIRS